jgi:hypothetical protein
LGWIFARRHDEGRIMSRFAAIDVAIRLQLLSEAKTIDYGFLFKNTGTTPASGYNYDKTSMRRFLLAVADRLKRDDPPLNFAWRMVDIDQCLDADHLMLVSLIEDQIAADKAAQGQGSAE